MSKIEYQLDNLIEETTKRMVSHQKVDGSFPSGQNGPYADSETPVRNTSHWIITLLEVYSKTGDTKILKAVENAIDYLLSKKARPGGATFHHRNTHNKDSCNGVVGQAWTIEALVTAGNALNRRGLIDLAEKVFVLHPFNERIGLWKQVEIDGTVLGFDATFNHQLWFAAAGSLLARQEAVSQEVEKQVLIFLDKLNNIISTTSSGIIYHRSLPEFDAKIAAELARIDKRMFVLSTLDWTNLTGNKVLDTVFNSRFAPVRRAPLSGNKHIAKSIGYHSFNLYALALLYQSHPDHDFWSTDIFKRIISYAESPEYPQRLQNNKFGYPYNPPGFEVPFALETFCGKQSREQQKDWLERQIKYTYDPKTCTLSRNNPDPTTLTARLYEATRLPNMEVTINTNHQYSE